MHGSSNAFPNAVSHAEAHCLADSCANIDSYDVPNTFAYAFADRVSDTIAYLRAHGHADGKANTKPDRCPNAV